MQKFKFPVFSLSDCDAWGIEISAIVKHGSVNMAYDNKNLVCPSMYWLGIWPTDLQLLAFKQVEGSLISTK